MSKLDSPQRTSNSQVASVIDIGRRRLPDSPISDKARTTMRRKMFAEEFLLRKAMLVLSSLSLLEGLILSKSPFTTTPHQTRSLTSVEDRRHKAPHGTQHNVPRIQQ
jgi:hypothetical protein